MESSCDCGLFQCYVHFAVRAFELFSGGVRRKFNMSFAKVAGYLDVFFWFTKGHSGATFGTGCGLPEIFGRETDMNAARGTGHFHISDRMIWQRHPYIFPKP